jgi:hypothetical protein
MVGYAEEEQNPAPLVNTAELAALPAGGWA